MASKVRQADQLKVFVSYSRHDLLVADALVAALEKHGFNVTIDRRDLPYGEKWQAELADFIRLSDTVVWLVSPASMASKWCNWEVDEVHRLNKRLVPVRIGNVAPGELPHQLSEIHILPAEGVFQLDRHLDALVKTLQTDRAWLKAYTRLADRAGQWLKKERASALLLRGSALGDAERWQDARPVNAPPPNSDVLELILGSRRAATRRQRGWIASSLTVALGAVGLAGFAWLQREAAVSAERQSRSTLALSDFTAARNETPPRALGRLARAVRTDPGKSAIARRALYLMAEQPHIIPLASHVKIPEGTKWLSPIMHDLAELSQNSPDEITISSPGTDNVWELKIGGQGTPCETSVCTRLAGSQNWIRSQVSDVYQPSSATLAANGDHAVLSHGVCMEFGGTYDILLVKRDGALGFKMTFDSEKVHKLALSPDGSLLFAERSPCGATIPGYVEKRLVYVFRIGSPDQAPTPLQTLSGPLDDLAFGANGELVRLGGRNYLRARLIQDERAREMPSTDGVPEYEAAASIVSNSKKFTAKSERTGHIIKVNVLDTKTGVTLLSDITVKTESLVMFFAPDDSWLAVAGVDGGLGGGYLRLIDIQTGLELRTRKRHVGPYQVSADGRRILAGGTSDAAGIYIEHPAFVDVLGDTRAAPGWVADLAEAIGGWHLDERNVFHQLDDKQRLTVLMNVRTTTMDRPANGDRWIEFAQWYLGDRNDGRVSPYASPKPAN